MRWPILLLGMLIAMAAVAIAVAVIGEPPGARGLDNPQLPTLLNGDPGAIRHERILPLGWLLGVLIMAFARTAMSNQVGDSTCSLS